MTDLVLRTVLLDVGPVALTAAVLATLALTGRRRRLGLRAAVFRPPAGRAPHVAQRHTEGRRMTGKAADAR